MSPASVVRSSVPSVVHLTWMPGWALDPFPSGAGQSVSTANIVTAVSYVVFLVILGPLVEELYFRAICCRASGGSAPGRR